MSNRAQYNLMTRAQPVPLAHLTDTLAAAGLPCRAQPERGRWFSIPLESYKSGGSAYIQNGAADLVLFTFDTTDPPSLAEKVEQVMWSIGFTQEQPPLWRMIVLPLIPWAAIMLLTYGFWRLVW